MRMEQTANSCSSSSAPIFLMLEAEQREVCQANPDGIDPKLRAKSRVTYAWYAWLAPPFGPRSPLHTVDLAQSCCFDQPVEQITLAQIRRIFEVATGHE